MESYDLDVFLMTFGASSAVQMHVWDGAGDVRDVNGEEFSSGLMRFRVSMQTYDPRDISFKFWYPGRLDPWEKDDFKRCVPGKEVARLWTAEYSPRCLVENPSKLKSLPVGATIEFKTITEKKFVNGQLYVWNPAEGNSRYFPQTQRDDAQSLSTFMVKLESWMVNGFHFKLLMADGRTFEPDSCNRFWRPIDGNIVYFKSGQITLSKMLPRRMAASIEVVVPSACERQSVFFIHDAVDDFSRTYGSGEAEIRRMNANYSICRYRLSLYPEALYRVVPSLENYTPPFDMPLTLHSGDEEKYHAVVGVPHWFDSLPKENATADIHVLPNSATAFASDIQLTWHLGYPKRTRLDPVSPICAVTAAQKTADKTWKASCKLLGGVPCWAERLSDTNGIVEDRPDGPFISQRCVTIPPNKVLTLYTTDGQSGFSSKPTAFADVAQEERAELMRTVFGTPVIDAGVFDLHEMPHGATWRGDTVYFVLYAPHAVDASVIFLDREKSKKKRVIREYPLQLTYDLRYWWGAITKNALPDPNHVEYRYLLNRTQEVLDPASREASDAEFVWADPDEGVEGAWSIAVDANEIRSRCDHPGWQTPFWNSMMIYELHAMRFTRRNQDVKAGNAPLAPFAQIIAELQPGKYLDQLPVTALELLPVNEFAKSISWGYSSSLYTAIESSYGGSEGLADLVKQAHSCGKSILLDVVYNHLTDSPLQAVAPDVFADGETQWGDMVNYSHPVVCEFFRQAALYLWRTYCLDGYRFDATEAIVNGHVNNGYIIRDGRTGDGKGWEFLGALSVALHRAADAAGRHWPFLIAENDPDNWGLTDANGVLDAQWDFSFQYPIDEEAEWREEDKVFQLCDVLNQHRPLHEMIRYAESHDTDSAQESSKKRVAYRPAYGCGMRMAKATGALYLLCKGVPMLFMGAEAAETNPFYFDVPQQDIPDDRFLDLSRYEEPGTENRQVLNWFRDLTGLRKNDANGLTEDDAPYVGKGRRTIAFSRGNGRYFVITTFGTPDQKQDLGWLGLPAGAQYKEVFNSQWDNYHVNFDGNTHNGKYQARLVSGDIVNLPEIGAVVLERA